MNPDDFQSDGGYETGFHVRQTERSTTDMRDIWTVARTEYRLSIRNRWALAVAGILAVFSLGMLTFSGSAAGPEGFARIVASLAVLSVYLVPLVALAVGYDVIVGADESGWLAALFALPSPRWRIVLGAHLGRTMALAAAIAIGFGIAGVMLLLEGGIFGWDAYARFLLSTIAMGLIFLGLATFVSTVAREKTHALGGVLAIWAWFVLIHDLLALGLIAAFRLPDALVSAMVLTNPAGIYRILVLGSLGAAGDAGFASVLAGVDMGWPLLTLALIIWMILPVTAAALLVNRRRIA